MRCRIWNAQAESPSRMDSPMKWLWASGFLFAVVLAPGRTPFETPPQESLASFVQTGDLGIPHDPGPMLYTQGVNGRFYPTHELGSLLLGIPFAKCAQVITCFTTRVSFAEAFDFSLVFFSAGLFATTLVLLALISREWGWLCGTNIRWLFLFVASSQYLVYAVYPPDVSISAPLLAWTFLAWQRAERVDSQAWLIPGFSSGALVLVKLTNFSVIPVLLGLCMTTPRIAWTARIKNIRLYALGLLPGLALTGWWNWIRTGSLRSEEH